MPQPQPNSSGRSSQATPDRRTKSIPVSAARSPSGGRPPQGLLGRAGKSGSILRHTSSGSSCLGIRASSITEWIDSLFMRAGCGMLFNSWTGLPKRFRREKR